MKKSYKYRVPARTTIVKNESYPAESLEKKMKRIMNNEEPIKDGAPLIYSERKDGVRPEFDVRTDKWEIASEAMDKLSRDRLARSMGNPNTTTKDTAQTVTVENKGETGGQSAEGTSQAGGENKS